MISKLIEDEYRVLEQIGQGGYGVVYRCEEVTLKRIVALKVLHLDPAEPREREAFLEEARTLASINHPNVVHIYRLGLFEGKPFIVMEYLRGETLRGLMSGGRAAVRPSLDVMRQVAAGLSAIHARNIVHRDLSPNNIMLTHSGVVKILDFGLARPADLLNTMSAGVSLVGTAPYLAPEQVQGQKASPASDVFSFGVVLYELLAHRHPFHAAHPMSMLYNIVSLDPEPILAHVPHCPATLVDVLDRCLKKRPDERLSDIGVVEQTLQQVLASPDLEAVFAGESRGEERSGPNVKRNPYLNRVMIKRPEYFFGRRQEIKRIYSRLAANPPGSISVVGDRKTGKSSLLNYVYMPANRRAHLDQPEKLIMLFIDLQEQKGMSVESFVKMVLGMASYELRGMSVNDCAPTLDGMKEMVQRIDRAGYRLALLFDEFEAITANPNFSLEFFSFLRFLANHYNVAYVTSSARDLQSFCHAKEISDSPFFNIFSTLHLTTFTREEACELITAPSSAAGEPLAKHVDNILELSGLFPIFLQIACCHAFEYLEDHPLGEILEVGELRRRFEEEVRPHYRYMWDTFDKHERNAMRQIVAKRNVPAALNHVVAELTRKGYAVVGKDRPRLFSSSFQEFVRTEAGKAERPSWLPGLFSKGAPAA